MKVLRLYADTSVFGGCFDEEFAEDSRKLFEEIREGRFILVGSFTGNASGIGEGANACSSSSRRSS